MNKKTLAKKEMAKSIFNLFDLYLFYIFLLSIFTNDLFFKEWISIILNFLIF